MRQIGCLLAIGLLVPGCGGKKKDRSEPAPAEPPAAAQVVADAAPPPLIGPTAPLWRMAPDDAVAGIVVADGALTLVADAWSGLAQVAADDPYLGARLAELASWLRGLTGVDPADHAAAGVDLGRGLAVFIDRRGAPLVAVVPWTDTASLAAAGRDQPLGSCVDVDRRVVCAANAAAVAAAAGATGDAPLARRAAELDGELRGPIELLAVPGKIRGLEPVRERLGRLLGEPGPFAAALTLEPGRARLRVHAAGSPGAPWRGLLLEPRRLPGLADRAAAGAGAVRLRLDPARFVDRAAAIGLPADLASIWSGEVALLTRGRGLLAGEIALPVADELRARQAVGPICNQLLRPFGPIQKLADGVCEVRLQPPPELVDNPLVALAIGALAGTPAVVKVEDRMLLISLGAVEAPAAATGEPERWQLSLRVRHIDPLLVASPTAAAPLVDAIAAMPARERQRLVGLRWAAAHVAELAAGLRIADDGVHFELAVTGFAVDGPPAYSRYRAAAAHLRRGDRAAYAAELAAAAGDYPDSHLARQSAAVAGSAPAIGPAALVGAALIPSLLRQPDDTRTGRKRKRQR